MCSEPLILNKRFAKVWKLHESDHQYWWGERIWEYLRVARFLSGWMSILENYYKIFNQKSYQVWQNQNKCANVFGVIFTLHSSHCNTNIVWFGVVHYSDKVIAENQVHLKVALWCQILITSSNFPNTSWKNPSKLHRASFCICLFSDLLNTVNDAQKFW